MSLLLWYSNLLTISGEVAFRASPPTFTELADVFTKAKQAEAARVREKIGPLKTANNVIVAEDTRKHADYLDSCAVLEGESAARIFISHCASSHPHSLNFLTVLLVSNFTPEEESHLNSLFFEAREW